MPSIIPLLETFTKVENSLTSCGDTDIMYHDVVGLSVTISRLGDIMLVEKLKDQWICSCGNWIGQALSWCPNCCEDQVDHSKDPSEEQQTSGRSFTRMNWDNSL